MMAGCDGSHPKVTNSPATIKVLSNRADLISGGQALVEVDPPQGVDASRLSVSLAGKNITSMFAVRENGLYEGMVTGLNKGANELTATVTDGASTSVTITNHSISGPVIYGPQIQPWSCDTGAMDAQCDRPVSFTYKYVSKNAVQSGFKNYDPGHPATDVATTTTDQGRVVPFIVRVETGVQDRDYYNVAVLYDPTKPWAPWAPQPGWNQKVLIMHGAGCGKGYGQSNLVAGQSVLDQYALSHGFAVMSVALNDSGHNCNIAVQAEATMMAKEHLIDTYGPIRYVMGYGNSGGALAQQWMANAYPGLYNGIIVGAAFPDYGSTATEIEDCGLLSGYFSSNGTAWSPAAQTVAAGHLTPSANGDSVCQNWANPVGLGTAYGYFNLWNASAQGIINVAGAPSFPGISSTALGGCDAPLAQIFSPSANPLGVRCDIWTYVSSILGRRQQDGYGSRAYSNVGVQYGLAALNAGAITPAQFVDLNQNIGSYDINGIWQASRSAADPGAVASAYASGWINEGNGMDQVAILQIRAADISDLHHLYRTWAMAARLDQSNGTHGNMAIWYDTNKSQGDAYDAMDAWLSAIEVDKSNTSLPQKIIADRPKQDSDLCGSNSGTGLTMQQCTGYLDASPRMAAGGPIQDDVIDCQLATLNRASYKVAFTDMQWSQLEAAFPSGVCDYSKAGSAQQPTVKWQTYIHPDGTVVSGGMPLPAAPSGSPAS
jgi:hypothetical protein